MDTLFPYTPLCRSLRLQRHQPRMILMETEQLAVARIETDRADRAVPFDLRNVAEQHPRIGNRREADAVGHFRPRRIAQRSEEHTSELQSLMRSSYAVFCLQKKK